MRVRIPRVLQREIPRRTSQQRNLLYPPRSSGRHRAMVRQYDTDGPYSVMRYRLPTSQAAMPVMGTVTAVQNLRRAACRVPLSTPFTTALLEHSLSRCWTIHELFHGPSRTCDQFAAAIRATAFQYVDSAISTEGALEGTNPCLSRFWREVFIAAFTAGS